MKKRTCWTCGDFQKNRGRFWCDSDEFLQLIQNLRMAEDCDYYYLGNKLIPKMLLQLIKWLRRNP